MLPLPDWSGFPGLQTFVTGDGWEMSTVDRAAIEAFASLVRPQVAVDVGTYNGGSARALRRHAERVVTIDLDPGADPGIDGVDFVAGYSWEALPRVLDDRVGLVLLDADHTLDGVRREVEAVLSWRPGRGVALLVHDAAQAREALLAVDWAGCPWVHGVALDFVPSAADGWGGLGFVWLDGRPREGGFVAQLDGEAVVMG